MKTRAPRLRVVPNRNTVGLVAVLLGMWYAGLTQSNGAAYLLCFVLTGMALVSIVHAWANLRGIRVEAQGVRSAFAGTEVVVKLRSLSDRRRVHFGVRVSPLEGGSAAVFPRIPGDGAAEGELHAFLPTRGFFNSLELRLESSYPLGFFTARTTLTLPAPHYVYPAPRGERPLPVTLTSRRTGTGGARTEGDDFAGVRAWRVGESQRHIDWKAVARGQPLVIKEWSGDADTTVQLAWEALADLPTEARLSQLAQWVLAAESAGRSYALRLPGSERAAARGEAHYHACLRALATFPAEVSA